MEANKLTTKSQEALSAAVSADSASLASTHLRRSSARTVSIAGSSILASRAVPSSRQISSSPARTR